MEKWNQAIQEIKSGLANNWYRNETAVSQSIVRRILELLKWDVNNPTIVAPEYTCGSFGRVDYALLDATGRPKVLIEVKAVGKIADGVIEQLSRYGYGAGAAIILLTDGQEWQFYYAAAGDVAMQDRRFYKIDILDRSDSEIYEEMQKYLGRQSVLSGEAFRMAEAMYRDTNLKRKAKATLPLAFKVLVDAEDDALCKLIREKTADLGGVLPEQSDVIEYLKALLVCADKPTIQASISSVTKPFSTSPSQSPTNHNGQKSSRSSFRMLGIKVGSELTASFNSALRFRVVDELNKIEDLQTGNIAPISRMAVMYLGGSRNGYEYFCYNGEKLSDLRQKFDSSYLHNNSNSML